MWETARDRTKYTSVHDFCGVAVENIMKLAVYKKTLDNITVVMLGLEGLETTLFPANQSHSNVNKASELKLDMDKVDRV